MLKEHLRCPEQWLGTTAQWYVSAYKLYILNKKGTLSYVLPTNFLRLVCTVANRFFHLMLYVKKDRYARLIEAQTKQYIIEDEVYCFYTNLLRSEENFTDSFKKWDFHNV